MNPNLLIVDDEKPTRDGLRAALEDRYEVYVAEDAASAANLLEAESFEVLLTDFRLPNNEDGMKLIARAKSLAKPPICILMTAYGSEELAVEALKQGADDYLAKGRMQIDELETRIARALKLRTLESENKTLKQQLNKKFGLENIIGESEPMQKVMDIVRQVAPSRATVLIQGESGTGKELIAGSVHHSSQRREEPYVRLNCAAIPETLLESELFGHEKGSFTGAVKQKSGQVEEANGGTLFLDEIGEMSRSLQAKLLRFLEDGTFVRVGGTEELRVDVRIIAATNRDIIEAIENGDFREDLYHR
ncbi:MAG: sigma-54 dependent transcriptional regulator, partial [Verrucomicrobiota bacterium]|nr:sigma-54 dependent transcriptional regulator [Verrucomicrobiota bacterium]